MSVDEIDTYLYFYRELDRQHLCDKSKFKTKLHVQMDGDKQE